jgi:hypothetical protein
MGNLKLMVIFGFPLEHLFLFFLHWLLWELFLFFHRHSLQLWVAFRTKPLYERRLYGISFGLNSLFFLFHRLTLHLLFTFRTLSLDPPCQDG